MRSRRRSASPSRAPSSDRPQTAARRRRAGSQPSAVDLRRWSRAPRVRRRSSPRRVRLRFAAQRRRRRCRRAGRRARFQGMRVVAQVDAAVVLTSPAGQRQRALVGQMRALERRQRVAEASSVEQKYSRPWRYASSARASCARTGRARRRAERGEVAARRRQHRPASRPPRRRRRGDGRRKVGSCKGGVCKSTLAAAIAY